MKTIEIQKLLDIGISLTTEKDYNKILELILTEAMNVTSCDGGTLYIYEDDALKFKIMRTISLNIYDGGDGKEINMPPVPMKEENICAYSAIHKKTVNIIDVAASDEFDFSGPKKYDAITGYHTKSLLVIPLVNHENELIGVLQLINALDENNNIIPFDKSCEHIVTSLASQAAVSLSNMLYMKELKELLNSFVSVMAAAIDQRTPYNANHTRNVAYYTEKFVDYINEQHEKGNVSEYFSKNRKEQLVLAARLHDIGKIVIPLKVMNKSTKLENDLDKIIERFKLISAYLKIDCLESRISGEEFNDEIKYINNCEELIKNVNNSGFLSDSLEKEVLKLSEKKYKNAEGNSINYITDNEKESLLIKKGTLTDAERKIMESHVAVTRKLLSNINFKHHYSEVPKIAANHHEYLDKSGYPERIGAENLTTDMRILTIIDIFEALTSKDRPYKKPMSNEKAFDILLSMADEGKIDKKLVTLLKESYSVK